MSSPPPPRPAGHAVPPLDVPPDMPIEYANLVRISHSPSEIVFDFAQLLPGNQSARMQSRIVMSPLGAKLFFRALAENLTKFENAFGEINLPSGPTLADFLFRPPAPPDTSPPK